LFLESGSVLYIEFLIRPFSETALSYNKSI
jgi:hypothetical protein